MDLAGPVINLAEGTIQEGDDLPLEEHHRGHKDYEN